MESKERDYPILLVDDADEFRQRMVMAFTRRGFPVYEAGDFDGAMEILEARPLKLAVFDLRMPGKSGIELVAAAKQAQPGLRIVVLTGYGSIATATQAIKLGAVNYLPKPADIDEILHAFFKGDDLPAEIEPSELPTPSLAQVEWEHIQRVLADCDGNVTEAARRLNIHRRSLQRKLAVAPDEIRGG